MATKNSPRKKVLDAALKALLVTLDLPKWLKAPATFVAELSSRFGDLPEKQQAAVRDASDRDFADALLQLDLATVNAAHAAAGTVRLEEQVAALRAAVESSSAPTIIKFPGAHVAQQVSGDGNVVVGSGSVHIDKVDMRRTAKRSRTPVLPGSVATDPYRYGYLQYLAKRFNEFKEWETGKAAMKYALIHQAYRREMKFSIGHTPLDRFEEAAAFLHRRIRSTMLGKTKAAEGNRLFESFEEFTNAHHATPTTS